MLILFPLIIGWLYLVFKPKLGLHFAAEFEKIHMTKQRVLTLVIFITVAILWIFGGIPQPNYFAIIGLTKTNWAVLTVWLHSPQRLSFV